MVPQGSSNFVDSTWGLAAAPPLGPATWQDAATPWILQRLAVRPANAAPKAPRASPPQPPACLSVPSEAQWLQPSPKSKAPRSFWLRLIRKLVAATICYRIARIKQMCQAQTKRSKLQRRLQEHWRCPRTCGAMTSGGVLSIASRDKSSAPP